MQYHLSGHLHCGHCCGLLQPASLQANICRVRMQDAFGNYVVQYVLELGHTEAAGAVMQHLSGRCAELSQQKFSSNVVEKCLKLTNPSLQASRDGIIRELMEAPQLSRLLQVLPLAASVTPPFPKMHALRLRHCIRVV